MANNAANDFISIFDGTDDSSTTAVYLFRLREPSYFVSVEVDLPMFWWATMARHVGEARDCGAT